LPALKALEEEVTRLPPFWKLRPSVPKAWRNAGSDRWSWCSAWASGRKSPTGYVRWAEAFTQSLQLNSTPLDVAEIFKKQMGGHPRAWIFTSATLAVQGKFHHYCAELGLGEPESACWESPFDYGNAGRALRAARHAGAEFLRLHRCRCRRRFSCRSGGSAVAHSSCAPACAPCAGRTNCSRRGWRTKATKCRC
jgi:hypothetical protein